MARRDLRGPAERGPTEDHAREPGHALRARPHEADHGDARSPRGRGRALDGRHARIEGLEAALLVVHRFDRRKALVSPLEHDGMLGTGSARAMQETLDLWDYRRRVHDLYR